MRFGRYLAGGLAICVALMAYFMWTSMLLVIFKVHDSPGGLISVGDHNAKLISGNHRLDFALFRITQDSDMSLVCAKGAPGLASRAGYFTMHLDYVVIVTIEGCEITEIEDAC